MAGKNRTILRLEAHQLDQASEMAGRAFYDDPFLEYLAPEEAKRARLTPSFIGKVIRYSSLYGDVYTTPALEGVACWLPPDNPTPTFLRMLRTGLLIEPLKFGWAGFRRFMKVVNYTEEVQKRSVPGPHWYLWVLGVDPAHQGEGIGGALMQPILMRAEADGLPCYLETMNERNVPFYQKHGFKVVSDGVVPKDGLRVWTMARDPHG